MNGHWPPTSSTTRHMPQTTDQTQFQRNEIIIFIFTMTFNWPKTSSSCEPICLLCSNGSVFRSKGMVCALRTLQTRLPLMDVCGKTTLRTTQRHKCYTTDGSEMVRNLLFPLIAHRSHWWQHWLSNHLVAGYLVFHSTVDTRWMYTVYFSIPPMSHSCACIYFVYRVCVSCGLESCRIECTTMSNTKMKITFTFPILGISHARFLNSFLGKTETWYVSKFNKIYFWWIFFGWPRHVPQNSMPTGDDCRLSAWCTRVSSTISLVRRFPRKIAVCTLVRWWYFIIVIIIPLLHCRYTKHKTQNTKHKHIVHEAFLVGVCCNVLSSNVDIL